MRSEKEVHELRGRAWWMRIVDLCGARTALGLGLEITRLGRFPTGVESG